MSDQAELEDLVAYLVRSSRLTAQEAARLVDEVLSFLDESPEQFVCRRHRELQAQSLANSEIFTRIAAELARRRFRAPALTARQIRRLIYG
jgi:polyhydroxyalkanoate synthesis regulator phasin